MILAIQIMDGMSKKLANPRIFDRDKIVEPEDKKVVCFRISILNQEEIEAITTAILGFTNEAIW